MNLDLTRRDQEFWEKHLEDFVPRRIYDMHTHLWTEKGQEHLAKDDPDPLRYEAGLAQLQEFSAKVYPGRECHFMLLATPIENMDTKAHNDFLAEEAARDPDSGSSMIVTPQTEMQELENGFSSGKFCGVKPYRIFAPDPRCARITEFLPERLLEVIHHYGRSVTLHLSMPMGAAAEENLQDLKYLTRKYPAVKWILAHCARAFNSSFLTEPIHVLKHLPNIFYDTSAVNDLYSHYLLLKHEDRSRIMFGSDNIVAGGMHGKYITYADAWQFFAGSPHLEHCRSESVPVIYEQLLVQKRACDMLELTPCEVEQLFYENGRRFIHSLKGS